MLGWLLTRKPAPTRRQETFVAQDELGRVSARIEVLPGYTGCYSCPREGTPSLVIPSMAEELRVMFQLFGRATTA